MSPLRRALFRGIMCGAGLATVFTVVLAYITANIQPGAVLAFGILLFLTGLIAAPISLIELVARTRPSSLQRDLFAAGITYAVAVVGLAVAWAQAAYVVNFIDKASVSSGLEGVARFASLLTGDPWLWAMLLAAALPFAVLAFLRLRELTTWSQMVVSVLATIACFGSWLSMVPTPEAEKTLWLVTAMIGSMAPGYRLADILEERLLGSRWGATSAGAPSLDR